MNGVLHAADGRASMISIHFDPPPMDDLAQGFGRAAAWGLFGALVPVWTRERLMEKEAGLAVDDAAELEALMEEEEEEEEEYTCPLCNNSNEVRLGHRLSCYTLRQLSRLHEKACRGQMSQWCSSWVHTIIAPMV